MTSGKYLKVIILLCLVVVYIWSYQGKDKEVSTEDALASLKVAITKEGFMNKLSQQAEEDEKQAPVNRARAKQIMDIFVSDYGIKPADIKIWGYWKKNIDFTYKDLTVSLIMLNAKVGYLVYICRTQVIDFPDDRREEAIALVWGDKEEYSDYEKTYYDKWVKVPGTPEHVTAVAMKYVKMPMEEYVKMRIETEKTINN